MAVRLKSDIFNTAAIEVPLDGSTDLADGSLCYRDTSNGVAKACSSTVGDATNILGVVVDNPSATATSCKVIPVIASEGQLWEIDCTNNTAANQLLKAHLLTDAVTLNNTSTHSTDTNAIFIALRAVGAAADKKLIGFFAKTNQVTA
jgi:hypothetical protein